VALSPNIRITIEHMQGHSPTGDTPDVKLPFFGHGKPPARAKAPRRMLRKPSKAEVNVANVGRVHGRYVNQPLPPERVRQK